MRNQHTTTIRNKFDTLQKTSKIHTLDIEYEHFITDHIEAVAESILTKPKAMCRVRVNNNKEKTRLHEKSIFT